MGGSDRTCYIDEDIAAAISLAFAPLPPPHRLSHSSNDPQRQSWMKSMMYANKWKDSDPVKRLPARKPSESACGRTEERPIT